MANPSHFDSGIGWHVPDCWHGSYPEPTQSRSPLGYAAICSGYFVVAPLGIRNYGPELTDASIDLMLSLAEKRPAMESAIREFIGNDVATDGGSDVTVPTAVSTSVPLPANTPTPNMFELTATAYFGEFSTALPAQPTAMPVPTETPRPMIEPTWTDYQHQTNGTPEPTVFLCNTVDDVTAGCTPRTPVPGN